MENTQHISLDVLVEIPKGSRNKYEYDHHLNMIRFDRKLFSPVHYPTDYGFFPNTLGEDGDPLDAMVLVTSPTFPGCVIEVRPVAMLKMFDEKGPDAKILCVPVTDPHWSHVQNMKTVNPHMIVEIGHFFQVYKDLEKKKVGIEGWHDVEVAVEEIYQAQLRFQQQH